MINTSERNVICKDYSQVLYYVVTLSVGGCSPRMYLGPPLITGAIVNITSSQGLHRIVSFPGFNPVTDGFLGFF